MSILCRGNLKLGISVSFFFIIKVMMIKMKN